MVDLKRLTLVFTCAALIGTGFASGMARAEPLTRQLDKTYEELSPAEKIAIKAAAKSAYKNKKLKELHVCADPGNMPLSDIDREGFQNKIIEVLGKSLGARVTYHWRPFIERGLTRETFSQRMCDVMLDIPENYERLLTTEPLYRSAYVLVWPTDEGLELTGLDDPKLKDLKIGVFQTSAIRQALAKRGIMENVVKQVQSHDGDLVVEHQPWYIIQRAIDGDVDVAGVWGPFAGWVKTIKGEDVTILPVNLDDDTVPLEFSLALGVRKTDVLLKYMLDYALDDNKDEIEKILRDYGVPLVKCSQCFIPGDLPSHGSYTAISQSDFKARPDLASPDQRVTKEKLEGWLEEGADPTQELFNAVTGNDKDRVAFLLTKGAKIDQLDNNGSAPIHIAANAKDAGMVEFLIEQGADPDLPDDTGMTPLIYSLLRDDVKTAQVLIDAGADLDKTSPQGYSPLALAIEEGRYEAAKALIEAGAAIDTPVGDQKLTPLMIASAKMRPAEGAIFLPDSTRPIDLARMLIKKGADVNATSSTGATPLMIAAARDNAPVIGLLLQSGADPEMKNDQGQTALDIAKMNDAQSAAQAITVLGRALSNTKRAQTESGAGASTP
ncbi:quinoprotein dehydrogenase-associated putative ABC transporter substrate-binding protein [Methyloligella sp. 2.7D]|uniref:quinoprotein dehydrogenase-associated putative ABC transporter substrate-binding protein n=1 Tax=unclassified Methyloligella TaxID=2625955 RepID=UPI00157C7E52|nr:quinoprotein dehydrogenase-associated putative ABC transporter substrate-binding protein [Methyloligella sp. GL2]QKP78057.1 quinoprotein dehydrogenase-associated putative ABC transporter substrate-binding protein [Methyloligella sp. GL2]